MLDRPFFKRTRTRAKSRRANIVTVTISLLIPALTPIGAYAESHIKVDSTIIEQLKSTEFAINVLVLLIIFYAAQAFIAVALALRKIGMFTIMFAGESKKIEIGLSPFQWTFQNIESFVLSWVFLIVALLLPVMFTFIPDAMLVYDPPNPGLTQILSTNGLEHAASVYYFCIALLVVFITMEVSFLLNLRDIGGPWVPMLLAALAIDLISLYFFNRMGNPLGWEGSSFEKGTTGFMFWVGVFCFLSSFMTILFSRAQREMVLEGLVSPSLVAAPPPKTSAGNKKTPSKSEGP